jgi:hypothetical protein
LHNEELQNLHPSPNEEVKKDWMGRVCSTQGKSRNAYIVFVVEPERKRSLGRPTRRGEDKIKLDLRDTGWEQRGLG